MTMSCREITFADLTTKTFDEVLPDSTTGGFNGEHCYGFYDWFCKDASLPNKARRLWDKAKSISRTTKFDPSKCYVFFKNNCPLNGGLYDDFRVCDIESGDVLYTVCPSRTVNGKSYAEVWGVDNDFEKPLVKGTWREIRAWFLG